MGEGEIAANEANDIDANADNTLVYTFTDYTVIIKDKYDWKHGQYFKTHGSKCEEDEDKEDIDKKSIELRIACSEEGDKIKEIMKSFLAEYRGRKSDKLDMWSDTRKSDCYGYLPYKNGKDEIRTYNDYVDETKIHVTKIECDGELIKPHNDAKIEFHTGDFRRIVADTFWVIYKQLKDNDTNINIKSITFNKANKDSITFKIDSKRTKLEAKNDKWDDGYVRFWCKDNNNLKKIGFPICLKECESYYEECSASLYYELSYYNEDNNTCRRNLDYYNSYEVLTKLHCNTKQWYNIALFSGEDQDLGKGIFYYHNDKLYPKLVINESNLKVYNVRSTFWSEKEEVIFEYNTNNANDGFKNINIIEDCKKKEIKDIDFKNIEQICENEAFRVIWEKTKNKIKNEHGFELQNKDVFSKTMENTPIVINFKGKKKNDEANSDYCWTGEQNTIEIDFKDKNSIVMIKSGDIINSGFVYKNHFTNKISSIITYKLTDDNLFRSLEKAGSIGETFGEQIRFVVDNIEVIGEIVDNLVSLIIEPQNEKIVKELVENSRDKNELNIEDFEKKLFEGLLPDRTVTNQVYDEVKKWRKEKDKIGGDPQIPNLVIMGSPGTGKTTLAKRIAKCFSDNDDPNDDNPKDDVTKKEGNFSQVSPSDLKGAYIGQTIPKVYDLLKDASENKQILFLDEAYLLQEDQFGREALAYLLPVMSGDRKTIIKESEEIETNDAGLVKKVKKIETFNFKEKGKGKGIPPIWMAGYEHQMRKTLSENPGLYRRMVKLRLQSPTASNLYENLMILADNNLELKKKFEDQSIQKDIKNYFIWAIARENSEYFGNYAGVQRFYETCEIREVATSNRAHDLINTIIEENKKEIKAQYAAVLSKNEKSRKFVVSRDIDTTFKDVIGEAVTNKLKPIVDMLIDHERYYECGINVPKGALLVGPPGTGKTLLARAVAGEFQQSQKELDSDKQIAFISVIGTELSTPELVEELFSEAADYDAAIIFIDEIDSMGVKREYSHNPEPMFQLLKEMDGFEQRTNIFVMAATNAPEILDEALKRPGRFDRYIEVSYPTKEERKDIIKMYVEKLKWFRDAQLTDDFLKNIASETKSFTPAQLKNLINEAAIDFETKDSQKTVKEFEEVVEEKIEQLKIGDKKPKPDGDEFSVEENKGCSAVAIHEVGHAMVCLLQGMEPFEKITILPRGNALGYVTPSSNNSLWTKQDYLNQIRALMGGRVAEELFYGEDDISVGAAQDIQSATKLAENMVAIFGMSEKIGVMSVKNDTSNFLGSVSKYECSESFRYDVEIEVRNLLRTQLEIVREELKKQKDIIKEMAEVVYGVETMSGDEFKEKYNEKRKEIEESSKKLRDSVSYDA